MAKDNAPVGYTCRTIDKIINLIKNLDLKEGQERDVSVIIDYIEEVRDSNERLREWGNELFDKLEQLEN